MIVCRVRLHFRCALLATVLLSGGLWLCVLVACTQTSHSVSASQPSTQRLKLLTASGILRIAPSFHHLDVTEDYAQSLGAGDTVKHLWHALNSALAAAALANDGNDTKLPLTNLPAFREALAKASAAEASHLCYWLKNDVMPSALPQKVLLAGLLTNTEALMPHYILQLLEFVASALPGSTFVSVYESGSTDRTALWLKVLAELLSFLEVPHHIETGGITRQDGEGRIPFLARLRNKVLEPLHWQHSHTNNGTDHIGHRSTTNGSSSSYTYLRSNATSSSSSSSRRGSSTNGSSMDSSSSSFGDEVEDGFVFTADKVVFLNDVYFCAQHVHRLLAHEGVNLACGLDYYFTSTASYVPKAWRQGILGLQPLFLRFYDSWVARDAEGTIFSRAFDHVARDSYGTHRMRQGLAFPVTCCWNGLAVFDAAPIQQSGLRFRNAMHGECPASECSHFCEDFRRLGYDKMIVDPAVRLGYDYDVAAALDQGKWQTFAPWSDAKHQTVDWQSVPQSPDMMCCPAPRIDACHIRSIYDFNYTDAALQEVMLAA